MIFDKITLVLISFTFALYIYFGPGIPKFKEGVDPRVQPYLNAFELEGKKQLGNCYRVPKVNIAVGDTRFIDPFSNGKLRVVGLCNYLTGNMIIDQWLFSLNSTVIEEVVFHELGHCVLFRLHIEEMVNKDMPMSLMYPIVIPEEIYKINRGYYMIELFSHNPMCDQNNP